MILVHLDRSRIQIDSSTIVFLLILQNFLEHVFHKTPENDCLWIYGFLIICFSQYVEMTFSANFDQMLLPEINKVKKLKKLMKTYPKLCFLDKFFL